MNSLALMLVGQAPIPETTAQPCRVISGKRQAERPRKDTTLGAQRLELTKRIVAMMREHEAVTKHDLSEELGVPMRQIESALDVMSYLGRVKWTRLSGRVVVWELVEAA